MAKFLFNGMDEISASFEQLSSITDDDKWSVIEPAAILLAERQRDKVKTLFRQITGKLAESITVRRNSGDEGSYAHIYLKGKHPGSGTGKRKLTRTPSGKSGGGRYSGTNGEIGFILEYGSLRISASHWMESTNEETEDEVIAAQEAAWDELMKKKGI